MGFPGGSVGKRICLQCRSPKFNLWVGNIPWSFDEEFACYPSFPGSSAVKNPPSNAEEVQSLVWEDPMEKEMTTYSSILAWEIPRTEEPGGLQSMGLT